MNNLGLCFNYNKWLQLCHEFVGFLKYFLKNESA